MSYQGTHGAAPAELQGFAEFFRAEFPRVVRGLMRAGATYEEAEDSAQEAMQALLRDWAICKSPTGWVRKAAWRAYCKKAIRNRTRMARESLHARMECPAPQDRTEPDEHAWVLHVLRALPPRQGQVLALYLDGYATWEIAELLEVKAGTVRSNLRHALTTVRASLENRADISEIAFREGGGPHAREG
ncbi:RNA polymerase sigma factor [Streptomyces sp. NPDC041068]|uniref:RNA polymerase sigma factor n=1 Tax=Streptomyces sp. NPDC041068 TaxID=3155130 RepID=UPI0033C703A9